MATWTISNLERDIATGGVQVAHWRVTESETVGDDTFTASSYGTVGFTPDADADGFVAYDDLTESAVLAWVHESVDQDATEAALTADVEAQYNPVPADGMPW